MKQVSRRVVPLLLSLFVSSPAHGADRSRPFTDVPEDAWYTEVVAQCQQDGLLIGVSETEFGVGQTVTAAEGITIAARLHRKNAAQGENGEISLLLDDAPWYHAYYEYAAAHFQEVPDMALAEEPASRADLARWIWEALQDAGTLDTRNAIPEDAIPDVSPDAPFFEAVYALYQSGICTGTDATGRFLPESHITREETAAIFVRAAHPEFRQDFSLETSRFTARPGERTLRNLLLTALEPVGQTMYIWGGAWNEEDTGSGIEAVTIGVSPRWEAFFQEQDSSYDYHTTRYRIHDGLDCTGYLGWIVYNVANTQDGQMGYVGKGMAKTFADTYGWGSYTQASQVTDYRAGDIMTTKGHVYLAVGQCDDGSVVLLHASPPGVQLCGTAAPNGTKNSQAVQLAEAYMSKYYPAWYAKFPDCSRGTSYLTDYDQMRWYLTPNSFLSDPDGYAQKSPEEILQDLFPSAKSEKSEAVSNEETASTDGADSI